MNKSISLNISVLKKLGFFTLSLLLFAPKIIAQTPPEKSSLKRQPNILFILVDDLGWADVNCFDPLNRGYYETPNIDRLAQEGMKFTQAYSNAANCTPSRAAIMSGQQYPHQPIYNVGKHPRPGLKKDLVSAYNADALPLQKVTLAEALRAGGYKTGFIGKWGIGASSNRPEQQGFDINIGGYIAHNPGEWEGGYFEPNNNPYINDAYQGEYLTDYLTRKAQEFIETNRNGPFYLQLSYYTVHSPLQAKEKLLQKYKKKKGTGKHDNPAYAAMIESLDQNVGKLMNTLKSLDIAQNTIVIFFSDNGGVGGYGYLGHPDNYITDNSPLKGGKTTYYEGGIRVPMIVRWPKVIQQGTRCNEAVIGVDFYPTLLKAAGIDQPENYKLDGQSILPLFKNPLSKLDKRALYWHFPGYPNNVWRTSPVSVIQYGNWKLIKFYEDFYKSGEVQLYNLDTDMSEKHDISTSEPEIAHKLLTKLEIWLEESNAPMPSKRLDGNN